MQKQDSMGSESGLNYHKKTPEELEAEEEDDLTSTYTNRVVLVCPWLISVLMSCECVSLSCHDRMS